MKLPKGIRQKKNGKFIADCCINGVRKTVTCETLDEAKKAYTALKLSFTEMRINSPKKEVWTLGEALDYCVSTRWKLLRNKDSMQTKAKHMLEFFGRDILITSITTRKVDEYVNHLLNKYKAGSVNCYLAGLSTVLRVAFDREMLDKLPRIPHMKNTSKRIRYLSDDEERNILDYYADDEEMRDIIVVLLDTGMRKGELFGLKKSNIDLDTDLISIWKTKTDKPRSIPMTRRVREIIERRISVITGFKSEHPDNIFTKSYVMFQYSWLRMRNVLGFKDDTDFVPHMLRHTCCSRLIQRGAELVKVMRWMGHSNVSTTMMYTHLSPNSLSDIKDLLEI